MSEHTKLPFKLSAERNGIYGCRDICDSEGNCIAIMDSRGGLAGSDEIEGNADLFVAACNDYERLKVANEALVKACEAILAMYKPASWIKWRGNANYPELNLAADAIALAKGGAE